MPHGEADSHPQSEFFDCGDGREQLENALLPDNADESLFFFFFFTCILFCRRMMRELCLGTFS